MAVRYATLLLTTGPTLRAQWLSVRSSRSAHALAGTPLLTSARTHIRWLWQRRLQLSARWMVGAHSHRKKKKMTLIPAHASSLEETYWLLALEITADLSQARPAPPPPSPVSRRPLRLHVTHRQPVASQDAPSPHKTDRPPSSPAAANQARQRSLDWDGGGRDSCTSKTRRYPSSPTLNLPKELPTSGCLMKLAMHGNASPSPIYRPTSPRDGCDWPP